MPEDVNYFVAPHVTSSATSSLKYSSFESMIVLLVVGPSSTSRLLLLLATS
jgi:hypothetical protein